MTSRLTTLIFVIVAGLVATISFFVVGPYNMHVDGGIYVSQIEQFNEGLLLKKPFDVALRAFKPLYGIWGALLMPPFSAAEAVQVLNLLFLLGLPFAAFGFLRELRFSARDAVWGALWVTTAYPVLKYGLAISTDIAGWFFTLATAYVALLGLRTRSVRLLVLASFLGFVGAAAKETGVMGLIFAGLYVLLSWKTRTLVDSIKYFAALALPAFLLEAMLFGALMLYGLPTFFDWYAMALTGADDASVFSLKSLIGVEGSTFNVMLLYAFAGVIALWVQRKEELPDYALYAALLVASLPVLFWTTIISRIVFVQCILVVPLALLGFRYIIEMSDREYRREAEFVFGVLPVIAAVILFSIAGKGSLFTFFFG